MPEQTIVLFGTLQHPTLAPLFHYLQERARRRVVFLPNELFPGHPAFDYQLSADGEDGRFLPVDQDPVEFADILSVGLDGFYVNPPGAESYNEQDREYLQTESWAALIGIFAALGRRCMVANHIVLRDHLSSRLATLGYLQSHGLLVPEACVSSDPEQARAFLQEMGGKVVYRPVASRDLPVRTWDPRNEDRLERLPLCPVYFEEYREGPLVTVTRVGPRLLTEPADVVLPEPLLASLDQACQGLDLNLAELCLQESERGWICTSLHPFLTPRLLGDRDAADMVAELFEE